METFFAFSALSFAAGWALPALVLVAALVIAGRHEDDPDTRRPYVLYLLTVTFVSLFVTLLAGYAAVAGAVEAGVDLDDHEVVPAEVLPIGGDFADVGVVAGGRSNTERALASAVRSALLAIAAGVVFVAHRRRLDEVVDDEAFEGGPGWRAWRSFLYTVTFVGVLLAVFSAAWAAYGLVRIVVPDLTAADTTGESQRGTIQLVGYGALAVASAWIAHSHWRRGEDPDDEVLEPATAG